MRILAAVLAAGDSTRFGADKVFRNLGARPVWKWSFDAFAAHPEIEAVGVVTRSDRVSEIANQASGATFVVTGGSTRSESAMAAVRAAEGYDALLLHDAARPFVSDELITRVVEGLREVGAATPGVPPTETLWLQEGAEMRPLSRPQMVALQTPQAARRSDLMQVLATQSGTDEASLLLQAGIPVKVVEGESENIKLTHPQDWAIAEARVGRLEVRTGFGYDIHAFRTPREPGTTLGGVRFEDCPTLEGHSDADVLLHAITDALLGAASLGDIGQHFPNTDERWRGVSSLLFLREAKSLLDQRRWRILNIDATVIAEMPKVMKRSGEIRALIAETLSVDLDRVSLKATTNEGLGSLGRAEGIAAHAVATIEGRHPNTD